MGLFDLFGSSSAEKDSAKRDIVRLGEYPQGENGEILPIEWILLTRLGTKGLLISRYCLDAKSFHQETEDMVWMGCSLREWLNHYFLNTAFKTSERKLILDTKLKNPGSFSRGLRDGHDTTDSVFLLDPGKASTYFPNDNKIIAEPTPYAKVRGVLTDKKGHCKWWLRAPGEDFKHAVVAKEKYGIDERGVTLGLSDVGVRPAMWVDFGSPDARRILYSGKTAAPEGQPVWKKGDLIEFGHVSSHIAHAFEPLEWQVLKRDDDKVLLISRYCLDVEHYNEEFKDITWAECSLRRDLNEDFLSLHFTEEEREKILVTHLKTPDPPGLETKGGADTEDRVFLLSWEEVMDYFDSEKARRAKYDEFHDLISIVLGGRREGYAAWALRSPSKHQTTPQCVYGEEGKFTNLISEPDSNPNLYFGVRPAMWIKADHLVPVRHEYVELGSYTQGEQGEVLPIEWQILKKEKNKAFVVSRYCLDARPYNEEAADVAWSECSLRRWLNTEFMEDAFTEEEQQKILVTRCENEGNPTAKKSGGPKTEDRVFLLSIEEAERYFESDLAGRAKYTGYVQMLDYNESGYGGWFLRSPGERPGSAAGRSDINHLDVVRSGWSVTERGAVRPAMWIDLDAVRQMNASRAESGAEKQPGAKREPVYFKLGRYPQGPRGEIRPIEWQILKRKGNRYLLISRYCLDAQPFNEKWALDVSWNDCSLRFWLNTEFLDDAFTEEEQSLLWASDTQDPVSLLTIEEAWKYIHSNEERRIELTEYALKLGAANYEDMGYGCWWIRHSDGNKAESPFVNPYGMLRSAILPSSGEYAVRPVIWIESDD